MKIQLVSGDHAVTISVKGKSTKKFKRVAKQARKMLPLGIDEGVEEEIHVGFTSHLSAQAERAEDE